MKRIVICSDGTWNTPGQPAPTNVTGIARAVLPTASDGAAQVVFYDAGIGTDGGWLTRLPGGVTGKGIEKNVGDGYRFLMHNYEEGDEIYLFGYSRGAYTVRSLAGLVRNAGLLRKTEADRFQDAYRLYRRLDAPPSSEEAIAFRATYSHEIVITFIGVWDTVGAFGIPLRGLGRLTAARHQFHDVELSRGVKHGYHALAIDEKRRPFRASLWKAKPKAGQTVEQAWFAGAHGDIGGSYGDSSLVDGPFTWMVEKASEVGLAFDEACVRRSVHPRPMGALRDSRKGLFKLSPAHLRVIGGDATQSVHRTARDRFEADASYTPRNLAAYLSSPEARACGEDHWSAPRKGRA